MANLNGTVVNGNLRVINDIAIDGTVTTDINNSGLITSTGRIRTSEDLIANKSVQAGKNFGAQPTMFSRSMTVDSAIIRVDSSNTTKRTLHIQPDETAGSASGTAGVIIGGAVGGTPDTTYKLKVNGSSYQGGDYVVKQKTSSAGGVYMTQSAFNTSPPSGVAGQVLFVIQGE